MPITLVRYSPRSSERTSRARLLRAVAAATVAFGALQGCAGADDSITIKGDVVGLDSLALRGDSLLAQADRAPRTIDSLRAMANGAVRRSPRGTRGASVRDSAVPLQMPGENPMTKRAQARGDSMARASAMKLAGTTASGRARGDTVRGVVELVGAEPARQAVLRTSTGSLVSLSGMATAGIARLAGAELTVRGVMITPRDVVVAAYIVRAMKGMPAIDGKLAGDPSGWWIDLTDGSGRRRIGVPPASLQGREGTRVWIAMKPGSSEPQAFGHIGRY